MAHTEAEIRRAIQPLLTAYGELNTTEVKDLLHLVLEFDEEDREYSSTRNEMKIMQRIGNIASHQAEPVKTYEEDGFILDKTCSPAKFTFWNPLSRQPLPPEEAGKMKHRAKRFAAKRIDWEKAGERRSALGRLGEEFAMEFEISRLAAFLKRDAAQYVRHSSRLEGDGLGYDISSLNEDGTPRFIEVKTTSGGFETPFYMSENERHFFEEYGESAFLYRVYDFDVQTRRGKVEILSQGGLFSDFSFETAAWRVEPRQME